MTQPRHRLSYSSPFTRPPLRLPGKARMIVWSVVNIEEWEITRPMARQISQAPMGQSAIPDMPNWTWYEYGMRVGFWRLLRALGAAGVTPTLSINAKVCETYPEVAAAARDAGWEFMAHAYVQMPIQQIEDQRAVIRQSVDLIEKFTGSGRTVGSAPAAARPSTPWITSPNADCAGSATGFSMTSRCGSKPPTARSSPFPTAPRSTTSP